MSGLALARLLAPLAMVAGAGGALAGTNDAGPPRCPATATMMPFAPPQGQPLRLRITTSRPSSTGGFTDFAMEYRLQFAAEGRGQRLTATLLQHRPDTPGTAAGALHSMLAPLVGRPVEYLVSGDGRALLMQNGDQLWREVADDLSAASIEARRAEARQLGSLLVALPPGEREALLSSDIRQMLRFAGRDWSADFAHAPDNGNSDCGQATLIERKPQELPGAKVVQQRRWQVDLRSGLVQRMSEESWLRPASESQPILAARTERTLTPE